MNKDFIKQAVIKLKLYKKWTVSADMKYSGNVELLL